MPSVSRPSGPKNKGTGQNRSWTSQRSRATATPTTTDVPAPEQVVTGCLYEAGFRTTGPHPQGGVAIAPSIDKARQRLADMLIFCDPAAAAVADITAFTPKRTVARYSGTVAELFADLNTGTADRTVHARPLVGLTTPRPADGRR